MRVLPHIAIVLLLAGCSPKEAARPSWSSGQDNIAYAVSAICAPYLFDGAEAAKLPTHQPLVHDDGWHESAFERIGARPVRVGYAGFVHVAVTEADGGRRCEISARPLAAPASMTLEDAQAGKTPAVNAETRGTAAVDAQALRAAALKALAQRREAFAPAKSHYLPGPFASEDMLCASARGAHPDGFALLSAARPEGEGTVFLTISNGPDRPASCDQKGVRMNYRTLVSDDRG